MLAACRISRPCAAPGAESASKPLSTPAPETRNTWRIARSAVDLSKCTWQLTAMRCDSMPAARTEASESRIVASARPFRSRAFSRRTVTAASARHHVTFPGSQCLTAFGRPRSPASLAVACGQRFEQVAVRDCSKSLEFSHLYARCRTYDSAFSRENPDLFIRRTIRCA